MADNILSSNEVQRDTRSGRPTKVRCEFALPPVPSAEPGPLTAATSGAPGNDAPVRAFLRQHAAELALPAEAGDLKLIQDVTTPTRRVLRYQQQKDGLKVLDRTVVVQVDPENRVRQLDMHHVPADGRADREMARAADAKKLTPDEALAKAAASLGAYQPRGEQPKRIEEVYFPTDQGLIRAYCVLILTANPPRDMKIVVDAHSGAILASENLLMTVDGQGMVFDPNPVVTAHNNTFRDPMASLGPCGFVGTAQATIDAQRVTRTLRDITQVSGKFRLEGPFVKIRNFGAPSLALPEELNANAFNYLSSDDRFEAVMVYYHVDTIQRYLQSIGIVTAFNSQIEADPNDNSGGGGAFYSPVDKGLHFGNSGACLPDRGEEADAILHEYGHAIQDNQVPGWGVTNPVTLRRETRAMGEGFGDILACVYFSDAGAGFQREVFEDWVFGSTSLGGLRRVDGTKIYPTDWQNQEHADGEIWSAALWNIYRVIGGDSMAVADHETARRALLKSVVLSHHRLAANASMPDGAEAVMLENAELPEYLGRHLPAMLDSFHARGLLTTEVGVDLHIRDAVGDPGVDQFTGPVFWDSPDLWIRNVDDNGTTHQNPEFGQDNYFYARVRNRGSKPARAFVVTFNVKPFAGVQFVYPDDWLPPTGFVSATVGFNLASGASTIVKAKWPKALVPPLGTHSCLLASVYNPADQIPVGRHVWEHNNLAQKNLTVVDLAPGDQVRIAVQMGSLHLGDPELARIDVLRPRGFPELKAALTHPNASVLRALLNVQQVDAKLARMRAPAPAAVLRFLDSTRIEIASVSGPVRLSIASGTSLDLNGHSQELDPSHPAEGFVSSSDVVVTPGGGGTVAFAAGRSAGFPVRLKPQSPLTLNWEVMLPPEVPRGKEVTVYLVQRNSQNRIIGGVTVRLRAK